MHLSGRTRRRIQRAFNALESGFLADATVAELAGHLSPGDARRELAELDAAHPDAGIGARLGQLDAALAEHARRDAYVADHGALGVQRFHAAGGSTILTLPVETFPDHVNNVYWVRSADGALLFDVGSGSSSARRDLALGFAVAREVFGEGARYEEIDVALVSHAHLDHFGGANDVRDRSRARLAVHELDARVLACFSERAILVAKDIDVYLRRAGGDVALRQKLLGMYKGSRERFRDVEPDHYLKDGDRVLGHEVVHVPGHCPGLVCLRVGDVMLSSDHVLARITPHQFPQAITPFAGLEHYFASLAKVRDLPVRLTLGGHEEPIHDLAARVDEIAAFTRRRLDDTAAALATPRSVVEVARVLFGEQAGYGDLLAIEEAGACVEYLHALGRLKVANLDEVTREADPVVLYVTRT